MRAATLDDVVDASAPFLYMCMAVALDVTIQWDHTETSNSTVLTEARLYAVDPVDPA